MNTKIFILILLLSFSLKAEEYAVITNKSVKNLSLSQIKAIFLKKITYVADIKMVPINLEARDPIRLAFERKFLHMSFSRLKKYWTRQHYLGHRPPISMRSQQSIKSFVKKVDGAVGYIKVENLNVNEHIVFRWSVK